MSAFICNFTCDITKIAMARFGAKFAREKTSQKPSIVS